MEHFTRGLVIDSGGHGGIKMLRKVVQYHLIVRVTDRKLFQELINDIIFL